MVHGLQPGVHVVLGVSTEVIRPHPSVLRLRANHRALLVNIRAHASVASLQEEKRDQVSNVQSAGRWCFSAGDRDREIPCCPHQALTIQRKPMKETTQTKRFDQENHIWTNDSKILQ